jgi:hypothetical protein
VAVPLRLDRRESAVFAVDPAGRPDPGLPVPAAPGAVLAEVPGPWEARDEAGKAAAVPCPGDWARTPGWETFSGTLRFAAELAVPPLEARPDAAPLFVDLGRVGDLADVWVDGAPVGVRAWAPYVIELPASCGPGRHRLEVRVTNSMANAMDGLQQPSGLMGPVRLRAARRKGDPL